MDIKEGKTKIKNNTETSIVDFMFDGYLITVFQGNISDNDIIVKYKKLKKGCKLRQPSHTHWAVDFLLKLPQELLVETQDMWENTIPLQNNQFKTLKELIDSDETKSRLQRYTALNQYGEYSVEFLYTLMKLLAAQEKTNRNDAYMFGKVINELLKEDIDIYSILSNTRYTGRN